MAKVGSSRGLKNYIQEIRACATKEAEAERVHKELGKIRKKYTSSRALTTYEKKKYLWKLMYTKMLGYDVDFGHKQAMDMMAASTYAEKQVGYVVCGLLLSENDALLRLVINSVRTDLLSRNEAFQCLALEFTANVGGAEFAQLLAADVLSVVSHGATRPLVRKKAAFCLLRLLRKSANDPIILAEEWGSRMAALLEENDLGVLLGLTSLLIGIVSNNYSGYEACVPKLVEILERLRERDVPQHYTYYGIPTPWLQVKVLRALQYFPAPEDPAVLRSLKAAVRDILSGNDPVKNPNKNNAVHAIVFEAAATAVSIDDEELMLLVVNLMVRFLAVREANLRYLALENLGRLSQPHQISQAIAMHRKTIIACMTDPDPSIAGGALNLLFTTASKDTGAEIVDELISLIDRTDGMLRQDLVLKTAILAERFPSSPTWYVDTMLRLILCMGDASSNEVWHSVLHLVSSQEELHRHAAEKAVAILRDGVVNEAFLQCAAYILGEYGATISNSVDGDTRSASTTDIPSQFVLLHKHYHGSSSQVKAMMLNCYEKMRTRAVENTTLCKTIDAIMDSERRNIDPEIQQRALEYFALTSNPQVANIALQELPKWDVKNSVLLRKLVIVNDLDAQESREFQPAWIDDEATDIVTENIGGSGQNAANESAENDEETVKDSHVETSQTADLLDLLTFGDDDAGTNAAHMTDIVDVFNKAESSGLPPGEDEANQLEEPQHTPMPPMITAENPLFVDTDGPPHSTDPLIPVNELMNALYGSQSGVLYEDGNLQIGARMHRDDARPSDVELGFFIGNKTTSDVHITCLRPLRVDPIHFDVSFAVPPPTILPGQQVQVASTWTCLRPYVVLPEIQLQYRTSAGDQADRVLALPLTANKFAKPAVIPAEMFLKRWNQVTGPPFKLSRSLQGDFRDRDAVEAALVAFGMQPVVVPALGTRAVTAVAIFHCTNGKLKQVPCMACVSLEESGSTGLLLEVATADADVSASFLLGLIGMMETMEKAPFDL
jgi:AP-2 complex subunit alpha